MLGDHEPGGPERAMLSQMGKVLVLAGLGLILFGGLFWLIGKIPAAGRLPGDIEIEKETGHGRFRFYFPIATCILLSIILTLLLNLLFRLRQ